MMNEELAKGIGKDLPISTKKSINICDYIRKMPLEKAKYLLDEAIAGRKAIPVKRFCEGAGHKRGMGAGKFFNKTCKEIKRILELAEANAGYKGMDSTNLMIKSIKADKGAKSPHYGRHRGRAMKRTHIEVFVKEIEESKKSSTTSKQAKPIKENLGKEKPKVSPKNIEVKKND